MTGYRYTLCFVLICLSALFVGCSTLPRENQIAAQAPLQSQASAQAPGTTIVAIAPPAAPSEPPPNLLDFLGINQIQGKVCGGLGYLFRQAQNRLGKYFPGLEPKPPVKSITDPANLSEDSPPAVSAAAKIKAEEDAAEQKIKGLKYLSTIGCGGCYPDVEEALLAALDDCTEAVRYEAVKALRGPNRGPCKYCSSGSCCSAAVQKKLREIAYELNSSMCYIEPSERVRRLARLSLRSCGPPVPSASEELPSEGPRSESVTSQNAGSGGFRGAVSLASNVQSTQVQGNEKSNAVKFSSSFTSLSDVFPFSSRQVGEPATQDFWRLGLHEEDLDKAGVATNLDHHARKYTWERYTLNPNKFKTFEDARNALSCVRSCITGVGAELESVELSEEQLQVTKVLASGLRQALSPRIAEALEGLPLRKVSQPIGDKYGWHLLRIVEQHPSDARIR